MLKGNLLVGGRGRVDNQRFCISYISQMGPNCELFNEFLSCLQPSTDSKNNYSSVSLNKEKKKKRKGSTYTEEGREGGVRGREIDRSC